MEGGLIVCSAHEEKNDANDDDWYKSGMVGRWMDEWLVGIGCG